MNWLELLQQAVAATSRAEAARALSISRSSVSLLLSGKYPGKTASMARRVNTVFAPLRTQVCPHTGETLTIMDCAKICAHMPTSSPAALRHWKACKACAYNPNMKEQQPC